MAFAVNLILKLCTLYLILGIVSCNSNEDLDNDINNDNLKVEKLVVKQKSISFIQEGCDTTTVSCVRYDVLYPEFFPHEGEYTGKPSKPLKEDPSVAGFINNDINQLISNPNNLWEYDTIYSSPKDYFNDLVNLYNADNSEFSFLSAYTDKVEIKTVNNRYGILSLRILHDYYRGGAHGMYSYSSLSYDLFTSKRLEYSNIFINDSASNNELTRQIISILADTARKELGRNINLDDSESLKNDDYEILSEFGFFNPSEISVTENIVINRKGIIFIYNPYEIAPWVMGTIEVFMSYEELKKYFKSDSAINRMFVNDLQKNI